MLFRYQFKDNLYETVCIIPNCLFQLFQYQLEFFYTWNGYMHYSSLSLKSRVIINKLLSSMRLKFWIPWKVPYSDMVIILFDLTGYISLWDYGIIGFLLDLAWRKRWIYRAGRNFTHCRKQRILSCGFNFSLKKRCEIISCHLLFVEKNLSTKTQEEEAKRQTDPSTTIQIQFSSFSLPLFFLKK